MTVHVVQYVSGEIAGTFYEVDVVGEGIRMHRHPPVMAHNIIVLKGEAMIYGPGGSNLKRIAAGDVLDIDWASWHEIMALVPGTKLFNVSLVPLPPEYQLPEEDRETYVVGDLSHRLLEDGSLEMLAEYEGAFE